MEKWADNPVFHEFSDGHMFILSETEKVAERIYEIINRSTAGQLL